MVGANAQAAIIIMFWYPSGVTRNNPCSGGNTKTKVNNIVPSKNAPTLYILVSSPNLIMELLLLELKPCHNLPQHKVAKAIVLAMAALVPNPI